MGAYSSSKLKLYIGNQKIKRAYLGTEKIYSAGNIVTYFVDSTEVYQEEVDSDATCLSPASFTPTKSGWTFVGWREDSVPSISVLTNKTMGDDPVTLYAVFVQYITLYYDGNSATSGSVASQTGARYYNNGIVKNPTFILAANGFARTYYTFTGWNLGSPGATVTLSSSTTAYAQWVATVYNYGYAGSIQTFTAPIAGTYQLEVWGAQGGTAIADVPNWVYEYCPGGKGGYSTGSVYLQKGEVLYICVGGCPGAVVLTNPHGTDTSGEYETRTGEGYLGGYNGGGYGNSYYAETSEDENSTGGTYEYTHYGVGAGGGGATHIGAFAERLVVHGSASGLYIVAGGGGGGAPNGTYGRYEGGTGGGLEGGYATGWDSSNSGIPGGQQASQSGGAFGQGNNSAYSWTGGGGGGGYYGGAAGGNYNGGVAGAGGSGYIGGVTNGSTTNGVREGNGWATITFLSA